MRYLVLELPASTATKSFKLIVYRLGNITVEEFAKAMKASGQSATEAEVQQIIREVDRDGDGTIDFEGKLFLLEYFEFRASSILPCYRFSQTLVLTDIPEFVAMMTGRPMAPTAPQPDPASAPEVDAEAEYESAWKEFDPSLQGSISAAQFRQVMAGMGETVTDAEVDEIINSVDGEDKVSCKLISI